jgi:hypothetical protein
MARHDEPEPMASKNVCFCADDKNRHDRIPPCRSVVLWVSTTLLAAGAAAVALAIAFLFAVAVAIAIAVAAAHALALAVALAAALIEEPAAVALGVAILSEGETACDEQCGEDGGDGFRFHVLVLLFIGLMQERNLPPLQWIKPAQHELPPWI